MASPQATFFHRAGWQRLMREVFRHDTHYLYAHDEGRITGVLPLAHVNSVLFGNALVSLPFCAYAGVGAADAASAAALEAEAESLALRLGVQHLELRHLQRQHPEWPEQDLYVTFRKAILPEEEANMLAIPRKQRAEVRRALGFGLDVEIGRGARDLGAHYRVYAESVRNLGTPVFPRALFAEVLSAFGDDADILTVSHKGRPLASVLSLYHKGTIFPYWGGGVADARTWRANDMMYYALMLHARRDKGCTHFDFGRSKAGTGPAAFKKNWGFVPEPLHYQYKLRKLEAIPDLNPLNPKLKIFIEIWKRLPLSVANAIGPMIVKNLG